MPLNNRTPGDFRKGTPLCPFCGGTDVYPIKKKKFFIRRTVAWSCANEQCRMYRRRFPSPSFGSYRRAPPR